MKRTAARLADGREIVYYDSDPAAVRDAPDRRALPPRAAAGELRRDPLSGDWIIVATHRQDRTHLPAQDECPLCPSADGRATEIPSPDYDVVVFENRFPSLTGPGDRGAGADGTTAAGGSVTGAVDGASAASGGRVRRASAGAPADGDDRLFARRPGGGRCEIVCFSPDHATSFADLPPERVRTVLDVWADRTLELSVLPGIQQIFPFENRGREIGVTLTHPHGQIYAYPYVTPRTRRTLAEARAYEQRTGRNLFADLVAAESEDGARVVARSEHWIAFVPHAARWPLEVHVYPRRHVPDLPALDDQERDDFCPLYLDLLRRVDALYGQPLPYVAAWHQAPVREARGLAHLRLELLSIRRSPTKIKYLAGSEAAMGAFINDVAPEQAAATLRAALSVAPVG